MVVICAMAVAAKGPRQETLSDIAGHPGRQDDKRERNGEDKDGRESQGRDDEMRPAFQRALCDPDHRVQHNGQHGGLEAEKTDATSATCP